MKSFSIILVWLVTVYAFAFAALSQTDIKIQVMFGLYILGICLVLFMVYTVLHDNYKTTKTFKDWYGDHPTKTLEEK